MPIQSLNWNDKIKSLADGDNLSRPQKKSLMDQYNSNIPSIQNQLGYLPSYGPTTNPSITNATVVSSAYDTSGNGGRKLVRLANGWIVIGVRDSAVGIKFFVSKDNFATTPTQLCFIGSTSYNSFAITSNGNKVYVIAAYSTMNVNSFSFDATTITNIDLIGTSAEKSVDTGQSAMGLTSLTYSPTDNTLHATWSSKNATYPNSFNIRYAKGTINGDGSVTWGSVDQRTTHNSAGIDAKNPSIITRNGFPHIFWDFVSGTNYTIRTMYYNGSSWVVGSGQGIDVTPLVTYTQSSPSATVDGNGHIHVAWMGRDATDTSFDNIRYSKSTDGGVTWSTMLKLTSGNSYHQSNPSITTNDINEIFVYWNGEFDGTGRDRIKSIKYSSSVWGSVIDVTTNTTADILFPSLCDNIKTFSLPLVIWRDNVSPSVKFSGTWTDTPLLSETTSTSAVSNKALIDAFITGNYPVRKRSASGSVTASSSTLTVTGLNFKPTFIIASQYTANYNDIAMMNTNIDSTKNMKATSTTASTNNGSTNSNGFSITVNSNVLYNWWAFE